MVLLKHTMSFSKHDSEETIRGRMIQHFDTPAGTIEFSKIFSVHWPDKDAVKYERHISSTIIGDLKDVC